MSADLGLPEGHYADLPGGLRLHYHSYGEGPAVLFFHGSGPGASGHSNFKRNGPYLAERGFRALLPDALGYGLSSKPEDAKYHIDFMIDGALGLLDSLGIEQCALVGNSMGGAMAIRMTLRHPERVEKLVLMAPGGLEEDEAYMAMKGIRTMVGAIYGSEGITLEGMRELFSLQLQGKKQVDEEVLAERYNMAMTQPRVVFETLKVPNMAAQLSQITCPVLGFWGGDDMFCPVSGATILAQKIPDCQVVLFSRCGHWVMVEREEAFNRLTAEFLAS